MVERNMCDAVMRGIVVPPGSRATSRAKGSRRKLGYLVTGRQGRVRGTVRIGKVRSRRTPRCRSRWVGELDVGGSASPSDECAGLSTFNFVGMSVSGGRAPYQELTRNWLRAFAATGTQAKTK